MRAVRISPCPAIDMPFLGFCAPPVYCNGRLHPSAVPRPRSSSSYPVCVLPLRIARVPSFDWRHVQGRPVARLPHRASPSHLPGVFHPGDTHGIFPFRGLTSSRAGSPLDDPCPSFPWLDTLPCRADWSRGPCCCGSGSRRRCHRFVPGFRTRVVLLCTPGFPAMRPSGAFSRARVGVRTRHCSFAGCRAPRVAPSGHRLPEGNRKLCPVRRKVGLGISGSCSHLRSMRSTGCARVLVTESARRSFLLPRSRFATSPRVYSSALESKG